MVLGPPWAPPVSRYVFRVVSGTLLSSILGDFWGTLGSHVSNFFGRVFLTVFRSPPEITFYSLLLNFGSILEPNWSQNGSQGPHAGPELDMLFTVYAPHGPLQGTPGFDAFSGSCPEGGLGHHFSWFLSILGDFWGTFFDHLGTLSSTFFIVFLSAVFNSFLSKMGLKSEGSFFKVKCLFPPSRTLPPLPPSRKESS